MRSKVIDTVKEFYDSKPERVITPGEDYIPVSGKVLDRDDLVNLVESSLDMWLTCLLYTSPSPRD